MALKMLPLSLRMGLRRVPNVEPEQTGDDPPKQAPHAVEFITA